MAGHNIAAMFNLSCVDQFRYPGVNEVYVTDLLPLTQGPATISSDQKLCFFDPLNLRLGPLKTILTSHGNLTCAKAYDLGGSVVATAGEDGSVSMWDLRQDGKQAEVARMTGASYEIPVPIKVRFVTMNRQPGAGSLSCLLKHGVFCSSGH